MVKKDNLILVVGSSGTGKTTIVRLLEDIGLNIIHSYTTRGPREENEWGHIFADNEVLQNTEDADILAFAELYNYKYWATKAQYRGKGTTLYVVCTEGAKEVRNRVDDATITTIFLMADEDVREKRMLKDRPAADVKERISKDRKLFSKSKCDYVLDVNREIELVMKDIMEMITEIEGAS